MQVDDTAPARPPDEDGPEPARPLPTLLDRLARANPDPSGSPSIVTATVAELLGCATTLWTLEEDRQTVRVSGWAHTHPERREALGELLDGWRQPADVGLVGRVLQEGAALVLPSASPSDVTTAGLGPESAYAPYLHRFGVRGLAMVPVRIGGTIHGVLSAWRDGDQAALGPSDIDSLLVLAAQAGHQLALARLVDQLARSAQLLDSFADAVVATDTTGLVTSLNPAAERLLGCPATEVVGHPVEEVCVVVSSIAGAGEAERRRALANRGHWTGEITLRRPDGTLVPVSATMSIVRAGDGGPVGAVHVYHDLSDLRAAEISSVEHAQLARAVLDALPSPAAVVDRDGRVVNANPGWARLAELGGGSGFARAGQDYVATLASQSRGPGSEALLAALRTCLAGAAGARTVDCSTEVSGQPRTYEVTVTPLPPGLDGRPRGVVVLHTDVTERVRLQAELARRATVDEVTGLPNSTLVADRLALAARVAHRDMRPWTVLLIDLDRFAEINDAHGHAAGDTVLRAVAERIVAAVGEVDTVARLGGDEFVVVATDVSRWVTRPKGSLLDGAPEVDNLTSAAPETIGALHLANALTEALAGSYPIADGREVSLSASVGVAVSRGTDKRGGEEMLSDARVAMFRAKELGRSRSVLFEAGMRVRAREHTELLHDLRGALARDEFDVHYQPIRRVEDNTVAGFEALVRWHHPVRGLVPPREFIGLAEGDGLIEAIGHLVLSRATAQLSAWRQHRDRRGWTVAVNLSAGQLADAGLPERVAVLLTQADLPADALQLEVTEAALTADRERSSAVVSALSEIGVEFNLDDFGAGHSSLTTLQRYPIRRVKIDGQFIGRLDDTDSTAGSGSSSPDLIVAGVVDLAHGLGLEVVAEGVETPAQLSALRGIGCDLYQGFLAGGQPRASIDLVLP